MTRAEIEGEFRAVLTLIREHAFLRYQPSGADEYAEKLNAASAHFAELVRRATGVSVTNPWPHASLERVTDARFASVLHCAKRSASALGAAASGKGDAERERLSAAAAAWTRARESLCKL